MTPKQEAVWRARIKRASDQAYRWAVTQVRRELQTCADEFDAGRFNEHAHAHRMDDLNAMIYAKTGATFASLGVEMLTDATDRRAPAAFAIERAADASQVGAAAARLDAALAALERRADVYFGDRVAALIQIQGPLRARAVAAHSQQIITDALAEAARQGMNEREAGRLVRSRLGGQLSVARARTIARTEIGAAQNAGMLAAADELGVQVLKTWVAIHDGRTRQTHELADGKTAVGAGKFQVGDGFLEYPGDPNGPPEEVINCRCTMFLEHVPQ